MFNRLFNKTMNVYIWRTFCSLRCALL